MGEKKVEGVLEWAEFLGLIVSELRTKPQALTPLGAAMTRLPRFPEDEQALEILYAVVARNHPLVNRLVNSFVYDMSLQFEPVFDRERFRVALLHASHGFNVSPAFLTKRAPIYLDLLTDPTNLGRIGTVAREADGKLFKVRSRRPDWRSAAYLLYAFWPENQSRTKIDELLSGQDSLGRIFCMTRPQVMALLSKLEQESIIALEMVADLNQVGLNPAMRAQDFLEMLIDG